MSGPDWAARFESLTAWLERHRPVWEHRTFIAQPAPWEAEHPTLAAWLRDLDEETIERLEASLRPGLDPAPEPLPSWLAEAEDRTNVPDLSAPVPEALQDPRLPR